jgi:hypothetical protein
LCALHVEGVDVAIAAWPGIARPLAGADQLEFVHEAVG